MNIQTIIFYLIILGFVSYGIFFIWKKIKEEKLFEDFLSMFKLKDDNYRLIQATPGKVYTIEELRRRFN